MPCNVTISQQRSTDVTNKLRATVVDNTSDTRDPSDVGLTPRAVARAPGEGRGRRESDASASFCSTDVTVASTGLSAAWFTRLINFKSPGIACPHQGVKGASRGYTFSSVIDF